MSYIKLAFSSRSETMSRCLLSKPELLGDPAAPTQHASTGESLSTRCERRRQGKGKGEGLGELDLPSTALVDVIRTLSSFPFLHTGGKADAVGGSVKEGGIPEHLQLAAVSVLRALVSGEGAKFIISSGERWQDPPGVRQAALEEREELEGGDDDAEEVEDDEEGEEWETGKSGVVGRWCDRKRHCWMLPSMSCAVLPPCFRDVIETAEEDHERLSTSAPDL